MISAVAKIYNIMILNRLRPEPISYLRCNQNGFRVGRATVRHILALRRLMEGNRASNIQAIITFIDLKKVSHIIHRSKMLNTLRVYSIYGQLVNAIARMY